MKIRTTALLTAAMLVFGAALPAAAQEPTSSAEPTPTSETVAPPSSTPSETPSAPTPTPTSEPPAPSSSETPPPPKPSTEDAKPADSVQPKQTPRPDLAVTVAFSQDEYAPESDMPVRIVVRNHGDAPAANVRIGHDLQSAWLKSGPAALDARPTIAPGAQHVIDVVTRGAGDVRVWVRATLDGVADPTPTNNQASDHAVVRNDRGSLTGLVYRDANGNGRPDSGEPAGNLSVFIRGGLPVVDTWVTTNSSGVFSKDDLPAGRYVIERLSSWDNPVVKPGQSEFVIEPNKQTKLEIAAVKPSADALTVKLVFDQERYARGDAASLTATITNTSGAPLTGVVAVCNPYGNPGEIDGTGPGWAPLNPDGPGLSLDTGETKVLQIQDVVPANAPYDLTASCNFGNNGRHVDGYRGATARARVTGLAGDLAGTLLNAETNQPIPGAKVVLLDPDTRQVVAVRESWIGSGHWELTNLRAGRLLLVVPGPWRVETATEVTVQADARVDVPVRVVPGPEVPDPTKHAPDLKITAAFEKPSFDKDEYIRVKVTIANVGTGFGSTGFRVKPQGYFDEGLVYDAGQWGEIASGYPRRAELAPGRSRELTIIGRAPYQTPNGLVRFKAELEADQDVDLSNNKVELSAGVTVDKGDAEIVLYGDDNANGTWDAGEELKDTNGFVDATTTSHSFPFRTDSSGRAVVKGLTVGTYRARSDYTEGWKSAGEVLFAVNANAVTEVEVRHVRPLSHWLKASVDFVHDSYRPGDTYQLDVTITNNTGADLPAVHAFCSGVGNRGEISNEGPGWGDLAYDGPGVPVANGETRKLRVSGPLSEEAGEIGFATAGCQFSPELGGSGDGPMGKDRVPVVGKFGSATVLLVHGDQPVPDTTVVLRDIFTKKLVARAVSGADGKFTVTDAPVGLYDPIVVGPWKASINTDLPYVRVTTTSHEWLQRITLEPGPEVADPGVPGPGGPGGGGGAGGAGGAEEALAQTGASVLGLVVLGALLVAFGFGARVFGRRAAVSSPSQPPSGVDAM